MRSSLVLGSAIALVVTFPLVASTAADGPPVSSQACLDRPADHLTVTGGVSLTEPLRDRAVPDDHTYDLRGTTLLGQQDTSQPDVNLKPINLGYDNLPRHLCIVGGTILGTHSRDVGWEYLKHDPGGGDHPAVRVGVTDWALIDGIRIDNMMNGFRPVGDGLHIRNAYLSYIRDDCLANDSLHEVHISDSLFDGCYSAFSARPESGSPLWDLGRDTSVMTLDRVLVRVHRMPGGFRIDDDSRRTFGHIWKWSAVSGPVVVRDSIFMAEPTGTDDDNDLDWPANVTAQNVVLVWDGPGDYPGRLPASGVVVTKDTSVWYEARADWLRRHGCSDPSTCEPRTTQATSDTAPVTSDTGEPVGPFLDVDASHVHADGIADAYEQSLMEGVSTTSFEPSGVLTRGQAATVLRRLAGLAGVSLDSPAPDAFADDEGSVHEPSIDVLADADLVHGFTDGSYAPSAPVTRAQFTNMLVEVYEEAAGIELPSGDVAFTDVVGSVHEQSIRKATTAGFVQGYSEAAFGTQDLIARAQVASMLVRIAATLGITE